MPGGHLSDGCWVGGPVVDDDDLQPLGRIVEDADGHQTVVELAGPVEGRDDDADGRSGTGRGRRAPDIEQAPATEVFAQGEDALLGKPKAGSHLGNGGAVAGSPKQPDRGRVDREHGQRFLADDLPGAGLSRFEPNRLAQPVLERDHREPSASAGRRWSSQPSSRSTSKTSRATSSAGRRTTRPSRCFTVPATNPRMRSKAGSVGSGGVAG